MPFVSSFLYGVIIFFFAFLFLLYIVMYPAIHSRSSLEMRTAYYILVVPEALKILSSYSFIGLLIAVPLYYRAKLHKSAILVFGTDKIYITGDKIDIAIPKSRIEKVFCNDVKNAFGESKEKLQVLIRQKGERLTTFRLKYYDEGGEFIDLVSTMEGVTLGGYDREMDTNHDDD